MLRGATAPSPGGDDEAIAGGLQDRAGWNSLDRNDVRLPRLDSTTSSGPKIIRIGVALRRDAKRCTSAATAPGADLVLQTRWPGGVQSMAPSVFFSRGALEARAGFCGNASRRPGYHRVDRPPHQPAARLGQPRFQFDRCFVGADRRTAPGRCKARRRPCGVMWITVTPVSVSPL